METQKWLNLSMMMGLRVAATANADNAEKNVFVLRM